MMTMMWLHYLYNDVLLTQVINDNNVAFHLWGGQFITNSNLENHMMTKICIQCILYIYVISKLKMNILFDYFNNHHNTLTIILIPSFNSFGVVLGPCLSQMTISTQSMRFKAKYFLVEDPLVDISPLCIFCIGLTFLH